MGKDLRERANFSPAARPLLCQESMRILDAIPAAVLVWFAIVVAS